MWKELPENLPWLAHKSALPDHQLSRVPPGSIPSPISRLDSSTYFFFPNMETKAHFAVLDNFNYGEWNNKLEQLGTKCISLKRDFSNHPLILRTFVRTEMLLGLNIKRESFCQRRDAQRLLVCLYKLFILISWTFAPTLHIGNDNNIHCLLHSCQLRLIIVKNKVDKNSNREDNVFYVDNY